MFHQGESDLLGRTLRLDHRLLGDEQRACGKHDDELADTAERAGESVTMIFSIRKRVSNLRTAKNTSGAVRHGI